MERELRAAVRAMVHDSLSLVRRPISSRAFKAVAAASAPGSLNIAVGGGSVELPGWLSTDVAWRSRYYLDLMKPWPVPPTVVERVYADNVIEHFTLANGRVVLRNIFNALRPGGLLRLVTPDVERAARAYLDDGDLARRHLQRHRDRGYLVYYPVDLLRVTFAESGHHLGFCFDYSSCANELTSAGFVDVHREETGESSDPVLAHLEARASETDVAMQLVVEARKPG